MKEAVVKDTGLKTSKNRRGVSKVCMALKIFADCNYTVSKANIYQPQGEALGFCEWEK